MSISPVIAIISGWFFSGLILGGAFLFLFNPLAGLAFLTLVTMGIIMFVMPVVHIVIMKSQKKENTYRPRVVVFFLIAIVFVSFFALSLTGIFNFT